MSKFRIHRISISVLLAILVTGIALAATIPSRQPQLKADDHAADKATSGHHASGFGGEDWRRLAHAL